MVLDRLQVGTYCITSLIGGFLSLDNIFLLKFEVRVC